MPSDLGRAGRALRHWTRLCGLALALVGFTVMASHVLAFPWTRQPRPTSLPFNTALAFALSGAALLALEAHRRVLATALGLAVALGAGVTGAQYLLRLDLGLDQAVARALTAAGDTTPEHMAPNTSLALLAAGLALALAGARPRMAAISANAAIAIAGVAALGHLLGARDAYAWADFPAMTTTVAWCLLALGSGLVSHVVRQEVRLADRSGGWIPWATGAFAALATLLLWRASLEQRSFAADRLTQTAARGIARDLVSRVENVAAALRVLHARLPPTRLHGSEELEPDLRWEVRSLHRRFPSVVAIERAEPPRTPSAQQTPAVVAWTRPHRRVGPPPLDARQLLWFERARASRETVVSPVFRLSDGHTAVRIIVPVGQSGRLPPLISAVVRADKLVASQLRAQGPEYAIDVMIGQVLVKRLQQPPTDRDWTNERVIDMGAGPPWRVRVSPAGLLLRALDNQLPEVVLGAGLLVALLLVIALRLAADATSRARTLAGEVAHRQRVETDLRRLGSDLERRVEDRTRELSAANAALAAENTLRRVAQASLARSNDDLRQFAAFVSHELRQPLATMSIWTDLLREAPQEIDGERAERYLAKIRASIDRMGRLIEGELALSQVAGTEFARDRVDLTALLPEVVSELDSRLKESDGRVELGPLPVVCGDAVQLRQLFRNLIENALKYRRAGVPPVIHITGELHSERRDDDGAPRCEIRVEDNGQGFTAEDAEVIFAIYRRRARNGEAPGSGIGLAICRRIVDRHGGSISALGRPGEGATFRIELPAMS